jgi:2',3'-cyclic-nucleotide 2'-phosphodiesterase (5'-nucleotidase family)
MKLRLLTVLALLALASLPPLRAAQVGPAIQHRPHRERIRPALDEVVGRARSDLTSPAGRFGDGPIWELIHRAQLEASGAEVSLAALPDPEARIAAGRIRARDVMKLYRHDHTLAVVELTGAELDQVLEHSARYLQEYTWEADRPLAGSAMPGSDFDSAEGVTYTIDLTRPVGDRVGGLSVRGAPLDPARRLRVAVSSYRLSGGGGFEAIRRARPVWRSGRRLIRDLLIEHVRRRGTLDDRFERNWTLLPDYVTTPERPLIDRMVRLGLARRDEVRMLGAGLPARRGDLAWWLARAFGWRERKLSNAWPDVPDSLAPWLDGLLRRGVLGAAAGGDRFGTWERASLGLALDWCEAAARHAGYALGSRLGDPSFRRGLLAGVFSPDTLASGARAAPPDTLTRSQVLGIVANARFPTLRILGTTDFHGAILGGARERRTERPIGGSAVLAAHLRRLAADNPEGTVLVDGGDCFQGTMISNLAFGRPVVEQMNALGYTAVAIGNHEFDWTVDTLARRVREMRFAALGANLKERRSGRRPAWAGSDTVVVRRGVRLGILGLCYRNTPEVTLPSHVAQLRFEDDSATAARIVPRLRRRSRADVVIGIGHIPATVDTAGAVQGDLARLARGVRGVDAWLGGHSHNQVSGEVNGIPTLIAGSHGQVVAVCDLAVDPMRDRVVERRYRLVTAYADEVEPDSAIHVLVSRWNAEVAPLAAHPVGRNAHHLGRTRAGESMVGNLVTDAIRSAVEADVALQNNGGLRADLPAGEVTWGMIYEVMPFENTVVTMQLTGRELRQMLEEGLRFERVTQVSGISYRFDLGAPPFSRVSSLTHPDGTPVDENLSYRVACNNFMAEGGDNYETLARGRERRKTGLAVRDLLAEYVRKLTDGSGSVDYRPEGRVVRVPGSPPPARGD